jgi:hypothetical protein
MFVCGFFNVTCACYSTACETLLFTDLVFKVYYIFFFSLHTVLFCTTRHRRASKPETLANRVMHPAVELGVVFPVHFLGRAKERKSEKRENSKSTTTNGCV